MWKCETTSWQNEYDTCILWKKNILKWKWSFFLHTPCTYPRWSYLESLHSDAHCVPYFGPSGGHQEFRTLRSSWKEKKKKVTERQRSLYGAWRANPVGYLFCHRGRETNTISCQLRSRGERRGTCRFFHPQDCAGFIPPWREKKTKLGRYSLREENWSAPGGVWRQWDKGHSES